MDFDFLGIIVVSRCNSAYISGSLLTYIALVELSTRTEFVYTQVTGAALRSASC